MSTETNKAIVSRYFEQVWNNGRLDLVDEFFAEDVIEHGIHAIPGLNGRDTLKAVLGEIRQGLPDIQVSLHEVIAEGDHVVTRSEMRATHEHELMGIPATGNKITQAAAGIFRLDNARIVEIWNFTDNLSLMQQLGAIPAPEAP